MEPAADVDWDDVLASDLSGKDCPEGMNVFGDEDVGDRAASAASSGAPPSLAIAMSASACSMAPPQECFTALQSAKALVGMSDAVPEFRIDHHQHILKSGTCVGCKLHHRNSLRYDCKLHLPMECTITWPPTWTSKHARLLCCAGRFTGRWSLLNSTPAQPNLCRSCGESHTANDRFSARLSVCS